jgi:hypothetical protein
VSSTLVASGAAYSVKGVHLLNISRFENLLDAKKISKKTIFCTNLDEPDSEPIIAFSDYVGNSHKLIPPVAKRNSLNP